MGFSTFGRRWVAAAIVGEDARNTHMSLAEVPRRLAARGYDLGATIEPDEDVDRGP
jgi:hypothetical protein